MSTEMRLAAAALGQKLAFRGFDKSVSVAQQEQFLAYGLAPGLVLQVLQQRPMTVILCEHTELAVEHSVAAGMIVTPA